MARVLLALALLSAPLLGAALCGDTAPRSQQELIHEQACVANQLKGDLDRAESNCELCLEFNERNSECLNSMGLVWFLRGGNNLGVIEFKNGNFLEAARFFESAIEVDPRYQDGRYNLALTNLRLGQVVMAKVPGGASVDQIVEAMSKADPYYAKAETHYRRMFELYPTHAPSYGDMGVIMMSRASATKTEDKRRVFIQDAEQYLVRCLEVDNVNHDCHGNLAHLYLVGGRFDEALFHFIQCLAQDKDDPICANELKQAYAGSQLKSEALRKYMDQLVANPGYAQGHYGFCLALFDKGLVDMAVTECENALKLDEGLCLAHYQLAKHYKSVLDKDLALANCRGLIRCAGDKHQSEVQDCKTIVQALEVQ
jgi:tetratricopeptide (TPR) repeat protein